MTLEPVSSFGLAKASIGATEAALRLSNTIIGRLRYNRHLTEQNLETVQRWAQLQADAEDMAAQLIRDELASAGTVQAWSIYLDGTDRMPQAASDLAQVRDQTIRELRRKSAPPDRRY